MSDETGKMTLEEIMASAPPAECEVQADGRVAHYMGDRVDGVWKCIRCGATIGRHGFMRKDADVA